MTDPVVLGSDPALELRAAAGLADDGPDPHFWLDPLRLAELGQQVADGLAEHRVTVVAATPSLPSGPRRSGMIASGPASPISP